MCDKENPMKIQSTCGNGINKKNNIMLSSNKCKFMFNRQNKSNHKMIDYFCCRYYFLYFPSIFPSSSFKKEKRRKKVTNYHSPKR